MAMSPQLASSQDSINNWGNKKGSAIRRIPTSWKQSSAPKPTQAEPYVVNKPMENNCLGRQNTVLVRKKLPWLDGSRPGQMPGHFDSKESPESDKAIPPPVPRKDSPPAIKRTTTPSLGQDPALRAVGSTPSLRKRARSGPSKSLSLSSQPRAGVKPVKSRHEAKKVLGIVDEAHKGPVYTSSEYSTTPSDDRKEAPALLPREDTLSHQRPVYRRTISRGEQEPFQVANPWLQSQVDLPMDDSISPLHIKKKSSRPIDKHLVGPQQDTKPLRVRTSSDSTCRSCNEPPPLRVMPKAKTLPRHTMAIMPPESDVAPPMLPAPERKPTLFAMPTHLLPSSSSSSHHDRHMQAEPSSWSTPPMPPPARPAPLVHSKGQRGSMTLRRESQSLNRAVTGLENLMEEALHVAKNAAENGRNDEVANILDNATLALRKATTVQGQMDVGRMSRPLALEPPSGSVSDSDSAAYSDASSMRSANHSIETAPTVVTKSAQSSQRPLVVDQYKPGGQAPVSHKASVQSTNGQPHRISPDRHSMSRTPPRLYQPPSADSIVRDFAYARKKTAKAAAARKLSKSYGSAADYYGDIGQSIGTQPGVRPSVSAPAMTKKPLPNVPGPSQKPTVGTTAINGEPDYGRRWGRTVNRIEHKPTNSIPPRTSSYNFDDPCRRNVLPDILDREATVPRRRHERQHHHHHLSDFFQSTDYRQQAKGQDRDLPATGDVKRNDSTVTDTRYGSNVEKRDSVSKSTMRYSAPPTSFLQRNFSLKHPRRKHISLKEGQGFSLGRYHRRQPIAREWNLGRKKITAAIACLNTVFIGLIAGIYAGEVPRIQYQLADQNHRVILGNVVLFSTLGATNLIFWPLPLLHGRKPYTLLAFALMLPLMFPQALVVSGYRNPYNPIYRCGLLIPRAFQGIAMGFANINFLPTLFDLFGASLMSEKPHQEIVVYDDIRRQGGGIGVWLGIWSFCFVGSMSIGFCVGATIIADLDAAWGFYIVVILLAFFLLVNVIAPETRRAPYRRSIGQYVDDDENVKRRVTRGEVKLHISMDGPKWWWQEVGAGLTLTRRMILQPGFFVLMFYLAWMYAQVTLVILFLGALLSRDYEWQPEYVGAATLSVAIGAFLAIPLSKANLFSRSRDKPARTDSMTMRHSGRISWSSHMLRRCIFTLTLPFAALAYTLSAAGNSVHWTTPTIFCGLVGFLSNLAIAECVGLIMETYDTCDLQPGVNQKHRLQSMAETTRRRRTNYSSFPRICAGFFAAQSLGFFLSAAATGVSGDVTRAVGAQTSTAIVAAILLGVTVLFIIVLWRWKEVQVIPNGALGSKTSLGSVNWGPSAEDPEWKPVVIGNPSGKMRRVNMLETGNLSRWTEIRKLNKLVKS